MTEFVSEPIRVVVADSFLKRAKGWLGRKNQSTQCKGLDHSALLLRPCNAIHTFGMSMPIDVVFLDRSAQVLSVHKSVQAWRVRWHVGAFQTLELSAGAATQKNIRPGLQLEITNTDEEK